MKIKVWSAGENGNKAKNYIADCLKLIMWQFGLIIVLTALNYDILRENKECIIVMATIWAVVMVFTLIGLTLYINALLKNTEFEIGILSHSEFKQSNYTINDIVFYDADGVVVTYNKKAYYDWEMFNRRESFREFKLLHS